MGTLVVDRVEMNETPQTGTWLFGFRITDPDGVESEFHIPNHEYEGDGIYIDLVNPNAPPGQQRVELTDIEPGTEIKWWMGLDDDEADVCAEDSAEDQARGTFKAKKRGFKRFSPKPDWTFGIYWHIEAD